MNAAHALGAKAFTIGNDIGFAEDRYQPGTAEGRRLLAHELTHVAQQSRGGPATTNAESRAHAAADRVAQGSSVSAEAQGGASTGVQCDEDEKKKEDASAPTPAPQPKPSAASGGVSFGTLGLGLPGLSSPFQFTQPQFGSGLPQVGPPYLTPPMFGSEMLPPGVEGPLPPPPLPPGLLTPPLSFPERKIDWLPLHMSYELRGGMMSDRDAEAIMKTYDLNSEMLNTFGITDRFKFLFITKEWILNKGLQKQVEDLNIRENPSALDKANDEFKRAYPGGWETPIVPIFSTDWFLDKSKK